MKTLLTTALFSLAVLPLTSCSVGAMWAGAFQRKGIHGEETHEVPACILSTEPGYAGSFWAEPDPTLYCHIRTDDGREYKADLRPLTLSGYSYARGRRESYLSSSLLYHAGQRGMLTVGNQSDAVYLFVPDKYAAMVEPSIDIRRGLPQNTGGCHGYYYTYNPYYSYYTLQPYTPF